jgi:hypothetical protein
MRRPTFVLLLGLVIAACGGSAPTAPAATPDVAPTSAATTGSPGPSSGTQDTELADGDLEALAAGLARPVTLANATEDQLIRSLIDASGIGQELGPETEAALADLIAAEREATRMELLKLGVDPGTLTDALFSAPVGVAWPGVRLASAQVTGDGGPVVAAPSPSAGFLAAVMAMTADLVHIEQVQADSAGHVGTTLSIDVSRAYAELTIVLKVKATVDLERCPDTVGDARGTVDVNIEVVAIRADGWQGFAAGGVLSITLKAVASDHADLVEVMSRTDGEVAVADVTGGDDGFTAQGLGVRLAVQGGAVDPVATGGWGSGTYRGMSGGSETILSLGNVLAARHGLAAERHWKSGACIMLEFEPPSPSVKNGTRTLEVTVSGLSMRDGATVSRGRLTVTPSAGTFAPTSGSLPLKIRVTVPDGAASAKAALEFRSVRGVGLRNLEVTSGTPREWTGQLFQDGTLGLAELGGGTGFSLLAFTLRATEDVVRPTKVDPKAPPPTIPLTLESASYTWSVQGTVRNWQAVSGKSTENVIALPYTDPFWPFTLPDKDFVAGEGFIDPVQMRLYVFLVAMGDRNSAGTFNLAPDTNCPYFHDKSTNQIFLWFDLDDELGVADGECSDRIPGAESGGQLVMQRTTSWHIAPISSDAGLDPDP